MMSQTHILLAAALLAKPGERLRNTAIVVGAFVPDAAIYTLFAWSKFAGIEERTVWDTLYWQEPWQTYTAAGNSIPLYGAAMVVGVALAQLVPALFRPGLFLTFFALAALLHIAADLPVHVNDAHRHFWPLSDWKFISPVSYWDPDHHGRLFSLVEAVGGLLLSIILFRRFKALWVRLALVLIMLAYVAVPTYFILQLGS
ncbi:MAG: hypothetical protein AAFQ10_15510 [Pseudomonadota bacterium]